MVKKHDGRETEEGGPGLAYCSSPASHTVENGPYPSELSNDTLSSIFELVSQMNGMESARPVV